MLFFASAAASPLYPVYQARFGFSAATLTASLQGVATGLATGPIGAALIDLQPPGSQRAPLLTSAFSALGLALGALVTSALVSTPRRRPA